MHRSVSMEQYFCSHPEYHPPCSMAKFEAQLTCWEKQMSGLARLRVKQVCNLKSMEVDAVVEFMLARLPTGVRRMKVSDLAKIDQTANNLEFSLDDQHPILRKLSFSCQTSPEQRVAKREHQTQTPVYTARKRSRTDVDAADLASKIRSQLAVESQHIILPMTSEYVEMPPVKKHQIVNILNAIVATYEGEDLDGLAGN